MTTASLKNCQVDIWCHVYDVRKGEHEIQKTFYLLRSIYKDKDIKKCQYGI